MHDTMKKRDGPIYRLLWYIGQLLWYYSNFENRSRIRPDYEGATAAVMVARETQPSHLVLTAELLYAIFGLYGRNMKFFTDGMEAASAGLVQIHEENRAKRYNSLAETFARLQLDNFKLPWQKLKEYELVRATLCGCSESASTPYTTDLTLRGIELVQEVSRFWATPNKSANSQSLGVLKARILRSTTGAQAKHLTAMLYMPVFRSGEPTELVKDAIESAVEFLDYLQNQSVLGRVQRLSLECTLLKSIMTMWEEVETSRKLLENYSLRTYLAAVRNFLGIMTISFSSKEDPVVWELKNSKLLGFNYTATQTADIE